MGRNKQQFFKRIQYFRFLIITLALPLFIFGCNDQRQKVVTWTEYKPVYMSQKELKKAVKMQSPEELKNPGKIYLYKDYLLVNEMNKGVHIIDNSNPAKPARIGFINIPMNKDIAVKDNLLYADSGRDLLVFDISNIRNPKLVARKEDVFQRSSNRPPGFPYEPVDTSKGIVVGWNAVKKHKVCKGDCYGIRPGVGGPIVGGGVAYNDAGSGSEAGANGKSGIGGSTARFTIEGDHLYAVDDYRLLTFKISSQKPVKQNVTNVGWSIETIFPYKNSLFIGSQDAMYIYDISSPALPTKLSRVSHTTGCDPVVVKNDFAYVTVRKNKGCPQKFGFNRLEVYDVHDLQNPRRIAVYEMQDPHGLGIDDSTLFVSEGSKGMKILNATNPDKIKLLRNITDINAKDLIPFHGVLIVTGNKGIYQYDYSNIHKLRLLSTIPVTQHN